MMQRRFFIGSRHVGAFVINSERALIVESPLMSSRAFVKNGAKPQRASTISRSPVSLLCLTIGWNVVGQRCSLHPALAAQLAADLRKVFCDLLLITATNVSTAHVIRLTHWQKLPDFPHPGRHFHKICSADEAFKHSSSMLLFSVTEEQSSRRRERKIAFDIAGNGEIGRRKETLATDTIGSQGYAGLLARHK
jgi:hypothetical protein